MIEFGLALMPEPEFAAAALPLFAEDLFDVVEWSFDMGWGPSGTPAWLDAICSDYAAEGGLLGHGVSYSLFAGESTPHHDGWLDRLKREVQRYSYRHVSCHSGFVGAGRFSFASLLPMPNQQRVVDMGRRRLTLMADAAGSRVGVENLATSLTVTDATEQGSLLASVVEAVDGFIVLDLHNLWCQLHNFGLPLDAVLPTYPLERVVELHVSGGSWDQRDGRQIRRDTHDQTVPDSVVALLPEVVAACPNLATVIYERVGTSLANPSTHDPFRADVRRLAAAVQAASEQQAPPSVPPQSEVQPRADRVVVTPADRTGDDRALALYQSRMLDVLSAGGTPTLMAAALAEAAATLDQPVDEFDPTLVDVAATLTQTWGRIS